MTKTELKKMAQKALKNEYGFAPALKDIILLEVSWDGKYIMFQVASKEYRFTSNIEYVGKPIKLYKDLV